MKFINKKTQYKIMMIKFLNKKASKMIFNKTKILLKNLRKSYKFNNLFSN